MDIEDVELKHVRQVREHGGAPHFAAEVGSLVANQLQAEKASKMDLYLHKVEISEKMRNCTIEISKKIRNYTVGIGLSLVAVIVIAAIYLRITLGD